MSGVGLLELAPALQQMPALVHLDLSGCWLLGRSNQELLEAVATGLTQLTHLDISSNGSPSVDDASVLMPSCCGCWLLQQLACLEHLNLRSNHLGLAGVEALAPTLHHLTRLTHLDLGGNKLSGLEHAHELRFALVHLKRLVRLDLSRNPLGLRCVEALLPVLCALPRLASLRVSATDLEPSALVAISGFPHADASAPGAAHDGFERHVDIDDNDGSDVDMAQ